MTNSNTIYFAFSFIALNAIFSHSNAQVGIGTDEPTRELDVNGNVRIRGLSSPSGEAAMVSVLPDGTLNTVFSQENAIGTLFIGLLDHDIPLDKPNYSTNTPPYSFEDIIIDNELLDVNDEYNDITGRYVPITNGVYKIVVSFDIGDYQDPDLDVDILIGLWDFTIDQWVLRRTFQHHNSNIGWYNNDTPDARNETFNFFNYINLTIGHSYGFRLIASYDDSIIEGFATLRSKNEGGTGASLSTIFSIIKIK